MTMPDIRAVFFWLGGVLTQSIPELFASLVYARPIEKVDVQVRLLLRRLTDELCIGHIGADEFCQAAIQVSRTSLSATELESSLRRAVQLRVDVFEVVRALSPATQCWLVCDFPARWADELLESSELPGCFPARQIVFTAECGLSRLAPDIFYYLAWRTGQPLGNCMVVDWVSPRAVEAIRHAMHAAIFVDARRLRREFVLRRMLPPPPGFVFPGAAIP